MNGQLRLDFASPGEAPAFELRRSATRRTLGLEVHADGRVIVRAPMRCAEPEIRRFVASRAGWVERQLAHFRERARARPPHEGARLLGAPLRVETAPGRPTGWHHAEGVLELRGRHAADPAAVARALLAWYRLEARRVFEALITRWHAHPEFASFPRPRLTIRAMRTRWGSLSSRSGMSLNLLLIHVPETAIEYVVVHELCHLHFHGHGKRFHALLGRLLPDWKARRALLEGGGSLAPRPGSADGE